MTEDFGSQPKYREHFQFLLVYVNGDTYQFAWYKEGKLHRDVDLPAVITFGGTQEWYKDGKKHREGDLPTVMAND